MDEATVARLRSHDWGEDPFERVDGEAEPYRLRLRDDGRCVFLLPDNRCRIHAELSYEAKRVADRA